MHSAVQSTKMKMLLVCLLFLVMHVPETWAGGRRVRKIVDTQETILDKIREIQVSVQNTCGVPEVPTTTVSVDHCLSNPCVHGICTSATFEYFCECEAGYQGDNCETSLCGEPAQFPNVVVVQESNRAVYTCNANYVPCKIVGPSLCQDSGVWSGSDPSCEQYRWNDQVGYQSLPVPCGERRELEVNIVATPTSNIVFDVGFERGTDKIFSFGARFNVHGTINTVVVTAFVNGAWQREIRPNDFPFSPNVKFEMNILFQHGKYKVTVDGTLLMEVPEYLAGSKPEFLYLSNLSVETAEILHVVGS